MRPMCTTASGLGLNEQSSRHSDSVSQLAESSRRAARAVEELLPAAPLGTCWLRVEGGQAAGFEEVSGEVVVDPATPTYHQRIHPLSAARCDETHRSPFDPARLLAHREVVEGVAEPAPHLLDDVDRLALECPQGPKLGGDRLAGPANRLVHSTGCCTKSRLDGPDHPARRVGLQLR